MNGTFVSQHLMGSSVALAKSCGATLHAWFLIHDSSIGDMDYAFPNDLRLTENVLTGDDAASMQRLLDALESLDDVQEVYTNAVIDQAA